MTADAQFYNVDAERSLLAKIIADDSQWLEVADRLTLDDFSEGHHRSIFGAMMALAKRGAQLVPVSIAAASKGAIGDVTASAYIAGLNALSGERGTVGVPTREFLDLILHCSAKRRLMAATDAIRSKVAASSIYVPRADMYAEAIKLLTDADGDEPSDSVQLGDVIARVLTHSNEAAHGKSVGLRTGLKAFDDLVGSMLPGNLIIIGGETSSGKTALGVELGYLLALNGAPVDMTSAEMEAFELGARVLATLSEISSERIIEGEVAESDLDHMMTMARRTIDLPFWINDRPGQTVGQIGARLAREVVRKGIKVAIIDHLQYVKPDDPRKDEREQTKQVVDDFKALAKRLSIVLMVLSHVSRSVEGTSIKIADDIKRPVLRDLYGSSAIEKAADAVVYVHRPIWFLERATPPAKLKERWSDDCFRWRGRAELVMPKRRSGKGFGVRECKFDERRTWFEDIADGETRH